MNRVIVNPITFTEHPTVPTLKVGTVGENQVVTGDHYTQGQLGFFIPQGGIVPEKLLKEMLLWADKFGRGRLAGKQGNRVKAREIGGVMSQGLFYGSQGASWNPEWKEGQDVTDEVGVTFQDKI
jgi:hypothetical protein